MKKTIISLTSIAALAGAVNAQTYDYFNDYSSTTNPNSPWTYRVYDGGTGWTNAYDGTGSSDWDSATVSTTGFPAIRNGALLTWHPDSSEHERYGVWFSAPTTGLYELTYEFTNVDQGGTNSVEIGTWAGGSAASLQNITNYVEGTGTGLVTAQYNLNSGQNLQFWVAEGDGNLTNDWVTVNRLRIQVVPEPSSTALLGLGALGLLVRRKR